jgi:hypothetical protein
VKAGAFGVGETCEAPHNLLLATRRVLGIMRRFDVFPQQPCPGRRERVSAHNRVPAFAAVDVLRRGKPITRLRRAPKVFASRMARQADHHSTAQCERVSARRSAILSRAGASTVHRSRCRLSVPTHRQNAELRRDFSVEVYEWQRVEE